MKILVCDDSTLMRRMVRDLLEKEHEIFEAKNGRAAVEMYDEHEPDLVFMDIVMPEITGMEALGTIVGKHPNAFVVMLSSIGTKENLKAAIDGGAADFIQKPVKPEVILGAVAKATKKLAAKGR